MPEQALRKSILDHFGKRAPSVVFEIPPDRLVNKEYCENLSDEIFKKLKWEVLLASQSIVDRIPETPGLYMFIWKPYFKLSIEKGDYEFRYVLYIGQANSDTSNLRTRFRSDYIDFIKSYSDSIWDKVEPNNREQRLKKYLNLWELEYWFCSITNREDLEKIDKLEIELIETLGPLINDMHRSKEIEVIKVKVKTTLVEKAPF
jgi:hypothetical protein